MDLKDLLGEHCTHNEKALAMRDALYLKMMHEVLQMLLPDDKLWEKKISLSKSRGV